MTLAILETALYADDLEATARFYEEVLGLERISAIEGRHVFLRMEGSVLLIFRPAATREPPGEGQLPVPPHGAEGPGHVCFRATDGGFDVWAARVADAGVPIESAFEWPQGGRSVYFRDPAGNSVEIAEPRIWGL